jgi:tRNA (mo5U34)-methyltransferase
MSYTKEELEQIAQSVPFWWHSIDLGQGVVTKGYKSIEGLEHELKVLRLPDLSGKTVLDIGAYDGFFSFEAERRGAARTVALEH